MKLFQKENTADTKFVYQTFPFPSCQSTGNSVLATPSSNVITNHYNRALLSTDGFGTTSGTAGAYVIGGRAYNFNTIMAEEEVYGGLAGATGSLYVSGWGGNIASMIGTGPATFLTANTVPQLTNGWMTKSPIKDGVSITGFRLSNVQNTGGGGITLIANVFEYDNTTDTFTIISTVSLTTILGGVIQKVTPIVNIPFTFTGNGNKHIGFALVSSNTGIVQSIGRAINIINS